MIPQSGSVAVLPPYGPVRISGVETLIVCGEPDAFLVLALDQWLLRLPMSKLDVAGFRAVSSHADLAAAFRVLRSRPKPQRPWSGRQGTYEAALRRGSLVDVALVVRDLHPVHEPGTERYRLYGTALDWLIRETATIEGSSLAAARERILATLNGPSSL